MSLFKIQNKKQGKPYFCFMKIISIFLSSCTLILIASCNNPSSDNNTETESKVPIVSYSITATLPHDTSYFTEGLEFYKNNLLESAGNYSVSKLLETDLKTGRIIRQQPLESKYFGEGITVLHDTLYQLTYKENTVFVYTANDFKKIKELPYNQGEGWGMTNDGKYLIASNGTSNIYFYQPGTFKLDHVLGITENGSAVININELEYINGYIYANQWEYNYILKIDPKSGEVIAKMDLSDIVNKLKFTDPHADVLNGIAYNPTTNKIYITGKYWPNLYEIQFAH
jgi:Glutamine cyclotransferase